MDASGSLGRSIVFSKWKGRNYVRRHVVPNNPQAALQVATRAVFKFLSEYWVALEAGQQASWAALAAASNISPFNAYIANGMNRNSQLKGPSAEYPATEEGTSPSAPTLVITGGTRNAQVAITEGANAADWGYFLYRKTGSAPAGLVSELIAIVGKAAETDYYSDSPLSPATYHYKAKGLMATGLFGALSAGASGVVT